jgi:hypothetical protein
MSNSLPSRRLLLRALPLGLLLAVLAPGLGDLVAWAAWHLGHLLP